MLTITPQNIAELTRLGVQITHNKDGSVTFSARQMTGSFDLVLEPSAGPVREEMRPAALRLFALFNRRHRTLMNKKEETAFRAAKIDEHDLMLVEAWYNDSHPEWDGQDYRVRDLQTLLNRWNATVDKATTWTAFEAGKSTAAPKKQFKSSI